MADPNPGFYSLGSLEQAQQDDNAEHGTCEQQTTTQMTNMPAFLTPQIDASLENWIQFQLNNPNNPFLQTFLQSGMNPEVATMFLRAMYAEAASPWFHQLKKRNWLMDIYKGLEEEYAIQNQGIDRVDSLSKDDFFKHYYSNNRPVILTSEVDRWDAFSKWTPDYLKARCSDVEVEVQTNRNQNERYEMDKLAHAEKMPFGQYVDMVVNTPHGNDFYMTAYNSGQHDPQLNCLLEDLHYWPEFMDAEPNGRVFIWLGPAGTLTPWHHDLTNNFMVQIAGRKKITLVPSSAVHQMYNHTHCFSEMNLQNPPDLNQFSLFGNVQPIEFILKPGEFFFLPVGWWHYVEALDQSLTVTGTNFAFANDFTPSYPFD